MVVGNGEAVQTLGKIKTNMDSGVFKAIQETAAYALLNGHDFIQTQNRLYQERRDIIVNGLRGLGWDIEAPKATFYIWLPVPEGTTSQQFTVDLLDKTGVLVVPGTGYGPNGEGYFRISITTSNDRLEEAIKRLKEHDIRFAKQESITA